MVWDGVVFIDLVVDTERVMLVGFKLYIDSRHENLREGVSSGTLWLWVNRVLLKFF